MSNLRFESGWISSTTRNQPVRLIPPSYIFHLHADGESDEGGVTALQRSVRKVTWIDFSKFRLSFFQKKMFRLSEDAHAYILFSTKIIKVLFSLMMVGLEFICLFTHQFDDVCWNS
jgi:hypothetical protein